MTNETKRSSWWSKHDCVVCGAKAIGINFGARTCAPCKAFFRRNARRKEILTYSCAFFDPSNRSACSQIRYCSSCRLRRCFQMGMNEELVRTDAENQRYRLLIQSNRERRRQLSLEANRSDQSSTVRSSIDDHLALQSIDWNELSNIVHGYESCCLKMYLQGRASCSTPLSNDRLETIHYHVKITVNNMKSLISFLLSLPSIQALSLSERRDLCQQNIRSLILLNSNELNQLCFSDSAQNNSQNLAIRYIYGETLYEKYLTTKADVEQHLINDPIVTRLWLVILFLSAPLDCDPHSSVPISRLTIFHVQQIYVTLLWKYLCHRHNASGACRIFANLIRIYLRIQDFSQAINRIVRTRTDLQNLDDAFSRAVTID